MFSIEDLIDIVKAESHYHFNEWNRFKSELSAQKSIN